MTFEMEKFVAAPTQGELMTLKKDELLLIVKHYKLEDIKRSMRKAAICNNLLRYFVEQGIRVRVRVRVSVRVRVRVRGRGRVR